MSSDPIIRITREEANSTHVDDLLKRQMSLRGEPIMKRSRNRAFFYQNWFVFMIVGMLGAAVAWAIVERFFHDRLYIQGVVTEVRFAGNPEEDTSPPDEKGFRRLLRPVATVTVHNQVIMIVAGSRVQTPGQPSQSLDYTSLINGEELGLWVRYQPNHGKPMAWTNSVVRHPAPQPAGTETSLDALSSRNSGVGLLIFPAVAAMIGLFIGAADGIICRLARRAFLAGGVGLLVGFVGGLVSSILGEIAYAPLTDMALKQMESDTTGMASLGFGLQVVGRSLAWGLCGMAMGLGQGLALRSGRLIIYGLIGGVIGGLLGGLLFDPIDSILMAGAKEGSEGAKYSRLVGFLVIGGTVGAMVGIVELLARDAWLRMTLGPLKGKEFLLFKDIMTIGSSPKSDLYLFNDPKVAPDHAMIRAIGENCDLEARSGAHPVSVNGVLVSRARLRHGDNVTIGNTSFAFQRRKG